MGENQRRKSILAGASGITAMALALALVIGIQLRAAIGALVGYMVGRLDRGQG